MGSRGSLGYDEELEGSVVTYLLSFFPAYDLLVVLGVLFLALFAVPLLYGMGWLSSIFPGDVNEENMEWFRIYFRSSRLLGGNFFVPVF